MKPSIERELEAIRQLVRDLETRLKNERSELGHRVVFDYGRKGEVPAPTEAQRGMALTTDGWATVTGSGGGGAGTPDGHTLAVVTGVLNAEPLSGTIDARIKNLSGSIDGRFNSWSPTVSHDSTLSGDGSGASPLSASPLSGTINARFIRGKVQTYTGTGTQTVPLDSDTSVLVINAASDLYMVGMTAGVDGRVVYVENSGTANAFVYHQHAAASEADRFIADVNSGYGYLVNRIGKGYAVYDGVSRKWRFGWAAGYYTPTAINVLGDATVGGNVLATYRLSGGTTKLGVLGTPYCDLTNGTVNNWNPHSGSPAGFPVYSFGIVDVTVATGANTITGIDATYASAGDLLTIINRTGYAITFTHQGGTSSAANRLYLEGLVSTTIPTGGSISFRYISASVGWQEVAAANVSSLSGTIDATLKAVFSASQVWSQTTNGTEGTVMTAVLPVAYAGPQYYAFITNSTGSNSPVYRIRNKNSASFQVVSTAPFNNGDKIDFLTISGGLGPVWDGSVIASLSGTVDARFFNLSSSINSRFSSVGGGYLGKGVGATTFAAGGFVKRGPFLLATFSGSSVDPMIVEGNVGSNSDWKVNGSAPTQSGSIMTLVNNATSQSANGFRLGSTHTGYNQKRLICEALVGPSAGADGFQLGVFDSSTATNVVNSGLNGLTGSFGIEVDIFNNRVGVIATGTVGNFISTSVTAGVFGNDILETTRFYRYYLDMTTNGANTHVTMSLYRDNWDNTDVTFPGYIGQWIVSKPSFDTWRMAVGARTGGTAGTFKVRSAFVQYTVDEWDLVSILPHTPRIDWRIF